MKTSRSLWFVLAVLLVSSACSAENNPSAGGAGPTASIAVVTRAGPSEFAARVDAPGVVTINVHVPDEGHIAGTDLTIPFDSITESTELPVDLDAPLAVYCRSGNMSASAVNDLAAMGYTDIVELEGGFNAWLESGRPLEPGTG